MPLFEVAVIYTKNKKDDKEELVIAPTPVVAKDEQGAILSVVMDFDGEIDKERMQVMIRPF